MFVPPEAVIPLEKLTHYLLVPRPWDDKSTFLASAGFTADHPTDLLDAIRRLAREVEAAHDGTNNYGVFWRIDGELMAPTGAALRVSLIWLQWTLDGSFHFVTLKPWKEKR